MSLKAALAWLAGVSAMLRTGVGCSNIACVGGTATRRVVLSRL